MKKPKPPRLRVEFVRARPDRGEIARIVCEVLGEIIKSMEESLKTRNTPEDEIGQLIQKEPKARA